MPKEALKTLVFQVNHNTFISFSAGKGCDCFQNPSRQWAGVRILRRSVKTVNIKQLQLITILSTTL